MSGQFFILEIFLTIFMLTGAGLKVLIQSSTPSLSENFFHLGKLEKQKQISNAYELNIQYFKRQIDFFKSNSLQEHQRLYLPQVCNATLFCCYHSYSYLIKNHF